MSRTHDRRRYIDFRSWVIYCNSVDFYHACILATHSVGAGTGTTTATTTARKYVRHTTYVWTLGNAAQAAFSVRTPSDGVRAAIFFCFVYRLKPAESRVIALAAATATMGRPRRNTGELPAIRPVSYARALRTRQSWRAPLTGGLIFVSQLVCQVA